MRRICIYCQTWESGGIEAFINNILQHMDVCLGTAEALKVLLTNGGIQTTVVWNKLYRRSLWDGILFPDGRLSEDTATIYQVFAKSERICIMSKAKVPLPDKSVWIDEGNESLTRVGLLGCSENAVQRIVANISGIRGTFKDRHDSSDYEHMVYDVGAWSVRTR